MRVGPQTDPSDSKQIACGRRSVLKHQCYARSYRRGAGGIRSPGNVTGVVQSGNPLLPKWGGSFCYDITIQTLAPGVFQTHVVVRMQCRSLFCGEDILRKTGSRAVVACGAGLLDGN